MKSGENLQVPARHCKAGRCRQEWPGVQTRVFPDRPVQSGIAQWLSHRGWLRGRRRQVQAVHGSGTGL